MENNWLGKVVIASIAISIVWVFWMGHTRSVDAGQKYADKQNAERIERLACDRGEYCSEFEGWRRSSGKYYAVRLPTGNYYFYGHKCTQQCEGHIAGYEWAIANEIVDFSRCLNNSPSFHNGCEIGVIQTRVDYGLSVE